MKVDHVEFLVEELSAEAALRQILPRILGEVSFDIYTHLCKDDLLAKLPQRLKGYSAWIPETWRVVVVVDRDDDDCIELKQHLEDIVENAGLTSRSRAKVPGQFTVVTRIAIEELEAWFFGDWKAVCSAYPRVSASIPEKASYRIPDAVKGGTWEAFERILRRAGYFKTGLRKIEAAQTVAKEMDPVRNVSTSFQVFRRVLEAWSPPSPPAA